ncbi:MAG: hypothetical protein IKD07_06970, partial [Clostridia bacterium]|nr:hypothetical protein [Clostridia bacterium]
SSVLCGSLRACQSLPYTADRASDSPAPSSFPSFICLLIPCPFFYGTSLLNKKLPFYYRKIKCCHRLAAHSSC